MVTKSKKSEKTVHQNDSHTFDESIVLHTAAQVLRTEGKALERLAAEIPDDFGAAVSLILSARGRVIISGMGKSGHIGRKIAATLASTGTPAQFVHPAEASHGDLGMVTQDDVCILLSNSGETSELSDMIAHTRRFSIAMIGISSKADSTLMRAADLKLVLPPEPEACVIGMAPTTSTTMTLALGDALAVAVMEQRGFQPDHFRTFHPGGKLGARLARVDQMMRGDESLPLVHPDAPMSEVLITMTQKGFGVAGLVDEDGRLGGIITDGDLRRHMDGLTQRTAKDVATLAPITSAADALAAEAVAVMNQKKIHMLFVIDDKHRPIGILYIHDCLRAGVA
jgi:arabinose-5-phosphate isomerase